MASRFIGELCFWKKSLLTALLAAAVACPLLLGVLKPEAQIAAASFEVASVKLADSSDGVPASASTSPRRSGGRFTWTATPTWLVCYAYGLPAWRVLGINGIQPFYGIDATMDSSATADQVRLMLQRLLADRLKLVAHRENRDSKGYALVVVKNGPKIKSAPMYGEPPQMPEYLKGKSASAFEGRIFVSMEGRGISALTGRGVSISQLADTLSETLGSSVWDKTGMTGKYYFGFKFLKDAGSSETELPTLFGAVQEELGLKLEPTKGPLEFLLVDHIEKVPTEN